MEGEARILQNRVEVTPLEWRIGDADEWIRGNENEKLESCGNPRLHGERIGFQLDR